MADGLNDLSRMRPCPCTLCDPKRLVSRAIGWRASLQAPAHPSPTHPVQVHPSESPRPPFGDRTTASMFCCAEQLRVQLECSGWGFCPTGPTGGAKSQGASCSLGPPLQMGNGGGKGPTQGRSPLRSASGEDQDVGSLSSEDTQCPSQSEMFTLSCPTLPCSF